MIWKKRHLVFATFVSVSFITCLLLIRDVQKTFKMKTEPTTETNDRDQPTTETKPKIEPPAMYGAKNCASIVVPEASGRDTVIGSPLAEFITLNSINTSGWVADISSAGDTLVDSNLPWWDQPNLTDCTAVYAHLKSPDSGLDQGRASAIAHLKRSEGIFKLQGNYSAMGHCGVRAWIQGSRQKVISYSLHGNSSRYTVGLEYLFQNIKRVYPGYLVRLHMDPRGRHELICPLMVNNPHLFLCDIKHLPGGLGDVSTSEPRLWRTALFGDPQVERINVRDADSGIYCREVAAVEEWTMSGAPLHLMRDHPSHRATVMAGMFGVFQPPQSLQLFEDIRKQLFIPTKLTDQQNLAKIIPRTMLEKAMQHDSFHCDSFPGSRPFPTQRDKEGNFVASRVTNRRIYYPCPEQCRPPEHLDWVSC